MIRSLCVSRRLKAQSGQGLVEYALVLAFVIAIGVGLLSVKPELKDAVVGVYDSVTALFGGS